MQARRHHIEPIFRDNLHADTDKSLGRCHRNQAMT
jgi:hypothetical protein